MSKSLFSFTSVVISSAIILVSQSVRAAAPSVLSQQVVRCTALLGGQLAFEFNPSTDGRLIKSIKIEAPDLAHTIKVQKNWEIPKSQTGVYFPLSAAEKANVQLMEPLIAIRANNHNNQVETFVWGAINKKDNSRFGILLHQKDGKISTVRFGNCVSL